MKMFMTEINGTDCDNFVDSSEITEICVGSIICIKDSGFYMLCAVDGNHVALIGLDGGNRWDEPVEVPTTVSHGFVSYDISLIGEMVGECDYTVVRKANISFS